MDLRAARFWSRVDQSGGPGACWLWTGVAFKATGYGQCTAYDTGRSTTAHRQAWLLTNGDPGTYVNERTGTTHKRKVLHRCPGGPNRLCCNPTHLAVGTDQDNADDRVADGNQARGERMGSARLTEADVLEMRRLHADGVRVGELARRFGVTHGTVGPAVRGVTWRHVGPRVDAS